MPDRDAATKIGFGAVKSKPSKPFWKIHRKMALSNLSREGNGSQREGPPTMLFPTSHVAVGFSCLVVLPTTHNNPY